jgi:hypothetical protein
MYIKYKERRITFQLIYNSAVDETLHNIQVPICTLAKVRVSHLKMTDTWQLLGEVSLTSESLS